jgi:hypothetical protein
MRTRCPHADRQLLGPVFSLRLQALRFSSAWGGTLPWSRSAGPGEGRKARVLEVKDKVHDEPYREHGSCLSQDYIIPLRFQIGFTVSSITVVRPGVLATS